MRVCVRACVRMRMRMRMHVRLRMGVCVCGCVGVARFLTFELDLSQLLQVEEDFELGVYRS